MNVLRIYKSAKGILKVSISDIEAGQWCKGDLAKINEKERSR